MNIKEILSVSPEDSHIVPSGTCQKHTFAAPQPNGAELLRAALTAQPKLQAEMDRCLEQLRPTLPPGVTYKVAVAVLPKSKPGSSAVKKALIRSILCRGSVDKTQDECMREVLAHYPGHTLSKDWGKPLPQWLRRYAEMFISGSTGPINQVSVPKGATLASLHRQVKDLVISSTLGSKTFSAKVTIGSDLLVINGHAFKVAETISAGRTYRYARINVQSLMQTIQVH